MTSTSKPVRIIVSKSEARARQRIDELEQRLALSKQLVADRDSEICELLGEVDDRDKKLTDLRERMGAAETSIEDQAQEIRKLRAVLVEERHCSKLTGDRNVEMESQAWRASKALVDLLLADHDRAEVEIDAKRRAEREQALSNVLGASPMQNGQPRT